MTLISNLYPLFFVFWQVQKTFLINQGTLGRFAPMDFKIHEKKKKPLKATFFFLFFN